MVFYPELVKKARELHKALGETKFRELYEKYPSSLATDLGVTTHGSSRNRAGSSVLQAFHFYPLGGAAKEAHDHILELLRKRQAQAFRSAALDTHSLRILEARGLIRIKEGHVGGIKHRLEITHVFENGAWKEVGK